MYHPSLSSHQVRSALPMGALILGLATFAATVPANAQTPASANNHPQPGTMMIPASNHVGAENTGILAHTNIRMIVPPSVPPGEAPPAAGYGYETPASLACIYYLVTPIKGCNPNATWRNPYGGSQTIAIVDAFDNPNAAADLAVFSQQFGLPLGANQFNVIYAKSTRPATDPSGGWEAEEALDVQWAHAMAPNAKLYLVEAATNSFNDLFIAVDVASHLVECGHMSACPPGAHGKGEVSMSWGGSEFPTESNFDWHFTGPNVVYLAATGDSPGVIYPSASPNVIGVGGTSNSRSLANGNLIAQIAWSDAGSGLSFYEPTPSYQSVLPMSLTQGSRALPDVSADANPYTGMWIYDSYPWGGTVYGWTIVGGTSASTPILAGILNTASTASGQFAASTAAELTRMYSQYPNSSAYHANFWDINYGACNYYMSTFSAGGYDLCTGLGTPKGLMGK
jgi:kumamolisin